MNDTHTSTENLDQPRRYEICLRGHLDNHWSHWFEGLTITLADSGNTHLTGPVRDQAALHGLLNKVRDLGLPLISLRQIEPTQTEETASHATH